MALSELDLKVLALELSSALPEPPAPPDIDMSHVGVTCRAIERMAAAFPWGNMAIREFLDDNGAMHLSDLSRQAVDELHARMTHYVDSAELGFN